MFFVKLNMNIEAIKGDIIEQIIKEKNELEKPQEAPRPTRQNAIYIEGPTLTAEREIKKLESKVNFGIAKLAILKDMIEEEKEKIRNETNKEVKGELEQKLKLLISENNKACEEVDDYVSRMRRRVEDMKKCLELHHTVLNRTITTLHDPLPEEDDKYQMYLMNGETNLCYKEQIDARVASMTKLMAKNKNKP